MLSITPEQRALVEIGVKAEALIDNEHFAELFDHVRDDLAKRMMATAQNAIAEREAFYKTFHGMDSFRDVLNGYIQDYRTIVDRAEQSEQTDFYTN